MYKHIKMKIFEKRMLKEKIHVIDVRESYEYEEGHIPHSINLPTSVFIKSMHILNKQEHYYIICRSGHRSQMVSEFLDRNGYQAVNVIGGIMAYRGELEI